MPTYLFPPTKLVARDLDDAILGGDYGTSCAVSGDGTTAVVGAPGQGFAAVFGRTGSTWTQQAILTGFGPLDDGGMFDETSRFGEDVAISHDGSTILVAGPSDDASDGVAGSAWVFVRSAGVWTQQGDKLKPPDVVLGTSHGSRFATSVALSADGNTALIGDPGARRTVRAWVIHSGTPLYTLDEGEASAAGVAYVFVRDADVWSVEDVLFPPHLEDEGPFYDTSPPVDDFNVVGASFGKAVSLSADGNVAICTAPDNFHAVDPTTLVPGSTFETEQGSIYSFLRDGAWGMVSNRVELTGQFADTAPFDVRFAFDVKLSPGGSRLAVAGLKREYPIDTGPLLNTWLCDVDETGALSDPGFPLLLGPSQPSYAWSADGVLFIAGLPFDQEVVVAELLVSSDDLPLPDDDAPSFGWSVDSSDDASLIVVGDPGSGGLGAGAAWIYRVQRLAVSFDGIEYAG